MTDWNFNKSWFSGHVECVLSNQYVDIVKVFLIEIMQKELW